MAQQPERTMAQLPERTMAQLLADISPIRRATDCAQLTTRRARAPETGEDRGVGTVFPISL
jgi:hypothetical protein